MVDGPALVNVGEGTWIEKEFGARVVVLTSPDGVSEVAGTCTQKEFGARVLTLTAPPEVRVALFALELMV